MTKILAALAALTLAPAAASAAELTAGRGGSIDLGSVRGVAYFTEVQGGFELVATLAAEGEAAPVRIVTRLQDGQTLLVSVPGAVGEAAREVEILRTGNRIVLRTPELAL